MTGKSSEVRRYRDSSKMNVVPARSARFRPCATTARLGSYVADVGAVGAVRRLRSKPGTSVTSFSEEPIKKAIFRARSVRNSRVRFDAGFLLFLLFFIVITFLFLESG